MIVNPPNGFWTEHDLEPEMMIYLWSMIDKAQTDKRDTLIGHITSSLELPDTKGKLERLLVEKSKELPFMDKPDLRAESFWVNFQKKHEFNPIHNHSGLYSFNIFVKIPYDLKKEFDSPRTQNIEQRFPGCFSFYCGNGLGEFVPHVIEADKEWEQVIILFPSITQHCVYPFYTSDDYRITVSGNLYLNPVTQSSVSYY